MRRMVLVLLLALGCGGDDDDATTGDLCDVIGDAYCARANACTGTSYNACFQAVKTGCCIDDGTCADRPPADAPTLGELRKVCAPAIETLACEEVAQGVLPAACLML